MQNYNHVWLSGQRFVDDNQYCKVMGLDPTLANTREINNHYLEQAPENEEILSKLLASNGLLEEITL